MGHPMTLYEYIAAMPEEARKEFAAAGREVFSSSKGQHLLKCLMDWERPAGTPAITREWDGRHWITRRRTGEELQQAVGAKEVVAALWDLSQSTAGISFSKD